jgi:hypothetical protein
MDKILEKIGVLVDEITDPDRIEKILELAVRLIEAYSRIKAI